MSPEERRDFYLYIDEFQNFTTFSIANIASELRKYHVGLILANQYLHQLDIDVQHSVLGNVGTLISFRLGPKDASVIAKEFDSMFEPTDLINLPTAGGRDGMKSHSDAQLQKELFPAASSLYFLLPVKLGDRLIAYRTTRPRARL